MLKSGNIMNKTVSFVSLFRNVKEGVVTWGATFKVDGRDIGASHLPKFDPSLFETKVSKDGKTKYLSSKRPLLVEYSDIRAGKVAGKFFTNIISLSDQPEMENDDLDALLAGEATDAEPAKDEPSPSQNIEF